jgi:hypothetical protein
MAAQCPEAPPTKGAVSKACKGAKPFGREPPLQEQLRYSRSACASERPPTAPLLRQVRDLPLTCLGDSRPAIPFRT